MAKRVLVLAIAACSQRAPIATCDDDLRGVYRDGGERWMVLDHGATLEAYPLFPDAVAPAGADAGLEIAPRVIDLTRGRGLLAGTLHRRYLRGAESCDARVPVHVTSCTGDLVALVLSDPAPPISFAPCWWPGPGPSRVVRWRRD